MRVLIAALGLRQSVRAFGFSKIAYRSLFIHPNMFDLKASALHEIRVVRRTVKDIERYIYCTKISYAQG
jgi:hypothetical protein